MPRFGGGGAGEGEERLQSEAKRTSCSLLSIKAEKRKM